MLATGARQQKEVHRTKSLCFCRSTGCPIQHNVAPLPPPPTNLGTTPTPLGTTPTPLGTTPAPLGTTPTPPATQTLCVVAACCYGQPVIRTARGGEEPQHGGCLEPPKHPKFAARVPAGGGHKFPPTPPNRNGSRLIKISLDRRSGSPAHPDPSR